MLSSEEVSELFDGLANSNPLINPREPDCECDYSYGQPASGCRYCRYGERFQTWREHWDLWLYANPNSWQARWLQRKMLNGAGIFDR